MLEILASMGHNNSRFGAALTVTRTPNQPIVEGSRMAANSICTAVGCGNKTLARGLCDMHYRRLKRRGSLETTKTPAGTAAKWMVEVALPYRGEECLIWPLAVDKDGYARGRHPIAATDRAHRVICILAHGEPPTPTHEAAHSCGKGHLGCVSPNHLSWKTSAENALDKDLHGTIPRGDESPMRKLTSVQVAKMLALSSTMRAGQIAAMFNVTPSNVSMILRGVTWKEVSQ